MKEYKLVKGKLNNKELPEIVESIINGSVFVSPTDTVYGLSGRADLTLVNEKINSLKEREGKPFINLVSSLEMIKKYCYLNHDQEIYFKEKILQSNRPTTVILKAKENTKLTTINNDGTLALRLPKSSFLTKIIDRIDVPLISTSLNISGKEIVNDLNVIKSGYFINGKPDFLINNGVNNVNKSSKLVDLTDVNNVKIIRD